MICRYSLLMNVNNEQLLFYRDANVNNIKLITNKFMCVRRIIYRTTGKMIRKKGINKDEN